jgi:hypothetical protein
VRELPHPSKDVFLSTLFLVPKKDGGQRPVINLKQLNGFVQAPHFKMEGIHTLKALLLPGDWMVKIDLKDAYFSVPIHPDHRKFLCFSLENKVYHFTCLPFGLASAPLVLTKTLRPVAALGRELGMRMIIYIDDILLMAKSRDETHDHASALVYLLECLGFIINQEKTILNPSQTLDFLGFTIDSAQMQMSLPPEKLKKIRAEWENDDAEGTKSDHRVGRIQPGLGSILPGHEHRGPLGLSGTTPAHKLSGTTNSHPGTEIICKEQNESVSIDKNRQHLSGRLYQQPGWNSIQGTSRPNQGIMDVVPGEEHPHRGTTPPRVAEPDSRQGIKVLEGPIRLEIGPQQIQMHQQSVWSTRSGPIHVQTYQPVPSLLQLAATSLCRGNRRLSAGLDISEGLCQPPLEFDPRVLMKVQAQRADVALVTPVWKTQPWYPLLLSLLVDWPCSLPHQLIHNPSLPEPRLAIWHISGRDTAIKAFRMRLQSSSLNPGGQKQTNPMTLSLGDGVAGVVNGVQIPFRDL